MDDDDDDTVVGTCLHCSAPPPPRSSSSRGGSSSGGGGGQCTGGNSTSATSSTTSPSAATRVQVSCDDCRSFICDACHWCHEFQANHEIRVCDRCDAFYCRGCDEMDQCEDCSEVVCNTCSTLMSCKFCGCGLCEDCATACGRCGIVLCARDAKFAVECDTCRMSYCLVCLASGTKDPCVRCGHRPSKRVEQLVHLRLKSIYKAFKQSGASVGPGSGSGGSGANSGGCKSEGSGKDGSATGGKYSSALRSLAENSSDSPSSKEGYSNFDQSMASEVAAVLQTASNSMAGSGGGDSSRRARGKRVPANDHGTSAGGGRNRLSSRASNAAAERYFRQNQAEVEKAVAAAEAEAEAAAAALLAELDEEEKTPNSKKSKKKKKKKEKKKETAEHQPSDSFTSTDNLKSADEDLGLEKIPPPKSSKGNRATSYAPPTDDDSSDEEMNFEQLVAGAKTGARPPKKDKKEENIEESKTVTTPPKPKPEPTPPVEVRTASTTNTATTADFEAELANLLSNKDEEGLETFLTNLKGVPGLGVARKTAKKALKRLKEARQPSAPYEAEKPQAQKSSGNAKKSSASNVETETRPAKSAAKATVQRQNSRVASTDNAPASSTVTQHEPLLRVVSRTQSNVTAATSKGGASSSTSIPASARAECVMHMSPAVVGWVIGKGGSRIRDMMEESGAKIWIDQESMHAKEARVVYVSGKRSCVDSAVRMVKDLVSKAPVAASAAASQGVAPAPSAVPAAKSAPAPTPSQKPSSLEQEAVAKEQPASFAAAITGSGASTPAATVTPPGPNPSKPVKEPAVTQGWALPVASATATLPQAAPQSVKATVTAAPPKQPAVATSTEAAGRTMLFPNVGDVHNAMAVVDKPANPSPLMAQMSSLHREISSSSATAANLLHEKSLRQEASSHQTQHLPPGYAQYHQQQNQNNVGLFQQDSSPTASRMSSADFLPDHDQQHQSLPPQVNVVPNPGAQSQDWGGHRGQGAPPMRPPYTSSLPPYSSGPTTDQYLAHQQSPQHNNISPQRPSASYAPPPPPSSFPLPQANQHLHFSQNHEAVQQQTAMPPPATQVHSNTTRINDFMRSDSSGHNMNGWDLPASGATMGGGTWNQSHQQAVASNAIQQPAFQVAQAAPPPLSNNPFHPQAQNHHPTAAVASSSQPTISGSNLISDDSLMVDSMFASLGGTGSGGDSGLLNALNSVSLGGGGGLATASQQGNNTNWESKIAGWGGEADSTNSSLLQQSRLGDYREEGG